MSQKNYLTKLPRAAGFHSQKLLLVLVFMSFWIHIVSTFCFISYISLFNAMEFSPVLINFFVVVKVLPEHVWKTQEA